MVSSGLRRGSPPLRGVPRPAARSALSEPTITRSLAARAIFTPGTFHGERRPSMAVPPCGCRFMSRECHEHLAGSLRAQRWVNPPPLTVEALRGKVVLVDFWEYTSVNWIRTVPYVEARNRVYAPLGLVVYYVGTRRPYACAQKPLGASDVRGRDRGDHRHAALRDQHRPELDRSRSSPIPGLWSLADQ